MNGTIVPATAYAGPTETGVKVRMTAKVNGVGLLGDLVSLDGVRAISRDRIKNGKRISSARGTKVFGLEVAGQSLGDINGKNVEIQMPTVGTLYVTEVTKPGSRQPHQVNGLRLKVSAVNPLLPSGGQLIISRAQARAY